ALTGDRSPTQSPGVATAPDCMARPKAPWISGITVSARRICQPIHQGTTPSGGAWINLATNWTRHGGKSYWRRSSPRPAIAAGRFWRFTSTHVHVVLQAELPPERVMNILKSYASRALNHLGLDGTDRKRWTRHGSTRYLWRDDDVIHAIEYVVHNKESRWKC